MTRYAPGLCRTCGTPTGDPDQWRCDTCMTRRAMTDLNGPRLLAHAAVLGVPVYRTRAGELTRITTWETEREDMPA